MKNTLPILLITCFILPLNAQELLFKELGRYSSGQTDAMEIVTYDRYSKSLFVTNGASKTIDILKIKSTSNPVLKKQIDISKYGGGVNSVVFFNKKYIAAAIENENKQQPGKIIFFNKKGKYINQVTVGALPDMVTVSPDGKKILCANEGEPTTDYSQDPEGSISIIDVSNGVKNIRPSDVTTLSFENAPKHIEGSIRKPDATYAQDLEPEYITVNQNSTLAAVTCQESNVMVIVDLKSNTILHYAGLGFKDHSLKENGFDASNKDKAINIKNWNVKGIYQPDAIASYILNDKTYFVTANEGDSRDATEIRLKKLKLDPQKFPNQEKLQKSKRLGQLKTFTSDMLGDTDNDGDVDELYCYGGRSFSIWNEKGELVWDSGDDFERYIAKNLPEIFNFYDNDINKKDNRSDDKGPEPEAVTVGKINNQYYAFVGLEAQGGIMVYNISDPIAPYFVDYLYNYDRQVGKMKDVAPECLLFIPANKSHTQSNLLISANEVSGTVTIYNVTSK